MGYCLQPNLQRMEVWKISYCLSIVRARTVKIDLGPLQMKGKSDPNILCYKTISIQEGGPLPYHLLIAYQSCYSVGLAASEPATPRVHKGETALRT